MREAWLVDPDAQTVTVFAAEGGKWITEHSVLFGEAIPSGLLDIGAGGLSEDS